MLLRERSDPLQSMEQVAFTDDYYALLGILQTADSAAIRQSYRRLAKATHPDKHPEDPNATAQFQLVRLLRMKQTMSVFV